MPENKSLAELAYEVAHEAFLRATEPHNFGAWKEVPEQSQDTIDELIRDMGEESSKGYEDG